MAVKTPPPASLSSKQVEYFTNMIKDNPQDTNSQNIINTIQKNYPALKDIRPETPTGAQNYLKFTKRMEQYKRLASEGVTPASISSGNVIVLANAHQNNFIASTESDLNNFFDTVTQAGNLGLKLPNEINSVVGKISATSKQFVGQIGNSLAEKLVPFVKNGMDKLAQYIFRIIQPYPAALATVIALQTALVSPVKSLFGAMDCLAAKMTDALTNTIKDMIVGMTKSVLNPVVCAAQQFVGALTGKIANLVNGFLRPFLGPIEAILSPIGAFFDIKNSIMGGLGMINKVANLFRCADSPKLQASDKWTLDTGMQKPDSQTEQQAKINKSVAAASNADAAKESKKQGLLGGISSGLSKFEEEYGEWEIFGGKLKDTTNQGIGNCNTGNIFACGAPKAEFFGGAGGDGVAGDVILGNFINHLDKEDIYGDIKKTGSIMGVNIKSPGQGYTEAPFVSFTDSCKQGYGAYGRAVIDTNINSPRYGQVTDIVILSEGEMYPTDNYQVKDGGPEEDDDGNLVDNTKILDSSNSETYIDKIIVDDPGSGYKDGDYFDGENENFKINIDVNGRIAGVEVLNQTGYDVFPELNIISENGLGSVLRPILKVRRKADTDIEIYKSVQCIGNFPQGE